MKNAAAVTLGRRGGQANKGKTTPAKAKAARENGKLGGRRKQEPPHSAQGQTYAQGKSDRDGD